MTNPFKLISTSYDGYGNATQYTIEYYGHKMTLGIQQYLDLIKKEETNSPIIKDTNDKHILNQIQKNIVYTMGQDAWEYLKEYMYSSCLQAREEVVDEIKWWLFDSGKFTNEDILKFKKKFERES